MDLSNAELLQLNRRGIFLGPTESDKDFFLRAQFSSQKSHVLPLVEKTFGSFPDWVEMRVLSKGLFPWEGAATWIEDSKTSRLCWIQIKNSFLTRFYPKEEVIAHEMVHAMRFMFDESRFEEILAYQTSKNLFRRYFGPMFTQSKESKWLVVLIAVSWFIYWAEILFDFGVFGDSILFAPLLIIGFGILRLMRSQTIFSDALRNLAKAINKESLPIALRLTDKEIELFAQSTPDQIRAFANRAQEESLRWRQLYHSYFSVDLFRES